jgi:hypothetical protein
MRWIKHPSGMGHHPAMSELRSVLGLAGYAALWLLLERVAETWNGVDEPELCLPEREWRVSCGFSAKKFQIFAEILQKHSIIRIEKCDSLLRLKAPILLQLQDEWTRKTRKNSGVDPESLRSHSGIQTEADPEKEKDNKTHAPPSLYRVLFPVLKRHGVRADSERGRNILRYVEQKQPKNPGGYLESIFQDKPDFDPVSDEGRTEHDHRQADRQQGPRLAGDILRDMGLFTPPPLSKDD